MALPDLCRANTCLTVVSTVELLNLSSHGGHCYANVHAAAVRRLARAVRRGEVDVAPSVAEGDQVVVLAGFDKLSQDDLSPMENNKCSTPEEVLRVAGRNRLRRLEILSSRFMQRRLPEFDKQAWMAAVEK